MTTKENDQQQQILNVMRNINNLTDTHRDQSTLSIIRSFLAKTRLFQSIIDEPDYEYILKETALILKYQKYKYGDFLFHQGERGDNLYFVLSGQGSVYIPKEEYEIKTEMIYFQKINQIESQIIKSSNQEQKNALKKQIEQLKSQSQSRNNSEFISIPDQNDELQFNNYQKAQKRIVKAINQHQKSDKIQDSEEDDDDEISILALNEKHHHRYFRISKEFSMYKRVRLEYYLDHFGELAAEEQFKRRMATVVASSKNEDFEVGYISLQEFKKIFTTVLDNLYLVQNTLCDQLINTSKKQTVNFSYLFTDIIKLERGQILFTENTPVNGVYIVRKGSISIKKINSESKQQLQLAILSPKDIFGHEDAFSTEMTRTISAVSEGYGTEVSFAKIEDIFAFLQHHKEFEKELKRKSELKINFYKKRTANVEQVYKNNLQIFNQKDKRINRVKIEEDQNSIFNKFLLNSRDKIVTQEDKNTIRSSINIQQVSKLVEKSSSQIIDAGNYLKNREQQQSDSKSPKSLIENQSNSKRNLNDNSQIQEQKVDVLTNFKGRSNLRTRSLVSINSEVSLEQYNNLITQFGNNDNQTKKNKVVILENSIERSINKQDQQQQSQQKQLKLLSRQTTFSQHSLSKFNQSTITNIEEFKPQNQECNDNQSQEASQNKTQKLQKQMSKKLKDAIAGQWNSNPKNWSVDQIEKQVKINSEQLTINQNQNRTSNTHKIENNNQELKLTYLHNDMDSFEHAKKFVIIKRQRKKTQYLSKISTQSSTGLNALENYKKQQQVKEQKARSPNSSPFDKLDDKFLKLEEEDPFFNPLISIQKFSKYLQANQQSQKSLDNNSMNNDIASLQKINTVSRFSLSEINSPISRGFTPIGNQFKPLSQQKQRRLKSNSIYKQEENPQNPQQDEMKKVVQLRKCQSTKIIDSHFGDDISEDFNEELQTTQIQQGQLDQQQKDPTRGLDNQLNEREKPIVPLIAFEQMQKQNNNIESLASQSLSKDQTEDKNIRKYQESAQKGFLLNLTQSPIQGQFDQQSPLKKTFYSLEPNKKLDKQLCQKSLDPTPNRSQVQSQYVTFSGIDLEDNNLEDKEAKYFLNSNYNQINGSYSPIIIQKLESQKHTGNQTSLFSISKQQISFVSPLSQNIHKYQDTEASQAPNLNNSKTRKQMNFQNSSNIQSPSNQNTQLLRRNIKSQISALRNQNKHSLIQQQKIFPTKLTSSNSQIPLSQIQKQLMNQNNNLLKNHLLNQIPKQKTANTQTSEFKVLDDVVSPIHSSISPSLRKSQIDRLHSSFKAGRNSISFSNNQVVSQMEKELPDNGLITPRQQESKIKRFQTESVNRYSIDLTISSKDELQLNSKNEQSYNNNNSNHKESKINLSTSKIFQGFSPQNTHSKNGLNVLRRSQFNKEEQTKGTLLSKAFPQKSKSQTKQKSQEMLREELATPQKQLLNMKKRKNILLSNKYSSNQYQQLQTDQPSILINQNQLFTITPYQSNSNLHSPTLLPKYIYNQPQTISQQH